LTFICPKNRLLLQQHQPKTNVEAAGKLCVNSSKSFKSKNLNWILKRNVWHDLISKTLVLSHKATVLKLMCKSHALHLTLTKRKEQILFLPGNSVSCTAASGMLLSSGCLPPAGMTPCVFSSTEMVLNSFSKGLAYSYLFTRDKPNSKSQILDVLAHFWNLDLKWWW
jgi:hypothetical protein